MSCKIINLGGLFVCLVLLLLLNSCDNTIDALNRKKGLYSIYGALNIGSKANYIRVKNLNIPLIDDTLRSLNASVRLKNLKTGESQLLTQDSIIVFNDVYTHNFKTTLPINSATTYKVTVKRHSDSFKEIAKAKTPIVTPVKVSPSIDPCGTNRFITFKNVLKGETIIPIIVFKKYANLKTRTGKATITYHPRVDKNISLGNGQHHPVVERYNMKRLLLDLYYTGRHAPPLPPDSISVCAGTLISPKVTIFYAIYGPGSQHHIQPGDLQIPGGIGQLVGFYTDSVSFTIIF